MNDGPRRVGLLGGTFDPPHLGHLVVAEHARVALRLDQVRLLVAGQPWMKSEITPARHRVAMAQLAVAGDPHLIVDDRETRHRGPTYTAETLEQLHDEAPGCEWVFLLGADAAARLADWHRAADALARARFVAVHRPGYRFEADDQLLADVEELAVPLIDISSTELRQRLADGGPTRYLLPPAVARYIRDAGLYRPTGL